MKLRNVENLISHIVYPSIKDKNEVKIDSDRKPIWENKYYDEVCRKQG